MVVDADARYARLLSNLAATGVIVEPKAGKWYWKVLGTLLTIVTFGKVDFWTFITTTVGNRIGTPTAWDSYPVSVKYEILMHESVHIRQYQRFGFGNAWVGLVPVGFAYLFLPFPIGFAWCRAKLEQEAYEASIRTIVKFVGPDAALVSKEYFVSQFTSPTYLWMWPFKSSVEKWFDNAVSRIILEEANARSTTAGSGLSFREPPRSPTA